MTHAIIKGSLAQYQTTATHVYINRIVQIPKTVLHGDTEIFLPP